MASILIVEDDSDIRDILKTYLLVEHYEIHEAQNLHEMSVELEKTKPDIILLDIMLPDGDSIDEIPFLRSRFPSVGIIVISARGTDRDKIFGIDSGADDYISKPFNPREVVSRVRALLKRISQDEKTMTFGSLTINPENYEVSMNEENLDLTVKEFEILHLLASHPKKVFSRSELIDRIWYDDDYISDRVIDVHISAIRNKIGKDWIKTIRNAGYKFNKKAGEKPT
jgi:two-component system OmpR family response regulator